MTTPSPPAGVLLRRCMGYWEATVDEKACPVEVSQSMGITSLPMRNVSGYGRSSVCVSVCDEGSFCFWPLEDRDIMNSHAGSVGEDEGCF